MARGGDEKSIVSRRDFLVAGGFAAGHLLLGDVPRREVTGGAADDRVRSVAEVRMKSASGGADVWFEPVGLRIEPGDTVRWVVDRGVHTSTAYHPENGDFPRRIPEGAEPWDSGYLTGEGEAHEHTFRREGVYDCLCRPHEAAGMVGRIVVARPDRTSHLDLPGWDGGARERELAPRGDEDAVEPDLPRAARMSFPSVTRILDEGRVFLKNASTVAAECWTERAPRRTQPKRRDLDRMRNAYGRS